MTETDLLIEQARGLLTEALVTSVLGLVLLVAGIALTLYLTR